MTARNSRSKSAEDKSDQKTAGTDESVTDQTTDADEKHDVATSPEESGDVNVEGAASGSVAGGVPRGETSLDETDLADNEADFGESDGSLGALGTVTEVDRSGQNYDVPWSYITADNVRTSDTDDGDAVAWNAQWAGGEREGHEDGTALVPVQSTPGQTFRPSELPNVEVMRAAGIDPAQWLSGLPVRAEVPDEGHRRGIPA